MRLMLKIAIAASVVWIGLAWAEQPPQGSRQKVGQSRMCAQLIHCGVKNGKVKQYPTRCAAQDDGATSIAPMQGASCTKGR
jgi:hypothetical protein